MIALGKFVSFFSRSNCWFFFNYGCLRGNEVPFPMFISPDCDVHMVLFRIIHMVLFYVATYATSCTQSKISPPSTIMPEVVNCYFCDHL